jgi:hypothetical protein
MEYLHKNKMKIKYIYAYSLPELENKIGHALDENWELFGWTFNYMEGKKVMFYQAVIKN